MPAKYTHWRPSQEAALDVTVTQYGRKRVIGLGLPTGSGKTGVDLGLGLLMNEPTCIVTDSRGLQDQYMHPDEGGALGMVDLRGRDNYTCNLREDYSCNEGRNARCPYVNTMQCPASKAEVKFGSSMLGITNYAKWTSARRSAAPYIQHFSQVIFDEGHAAPLALARAMQVKLHHKEMEDTLQLPFPDIPSAKKYEPEDMAQQMKQWKLWVDVGKELCEREMQVAKMRMESVKDPKPSWVRHYLHMRELNRRLGILRLASPHNWVVDEFKEVGGDHGFVFDPIRPGRYTDALLFGDVRRIVLTSATLNAKTLKLLGVKPENYHFQEFDSSFDPAKGPIYYLPTAFIDSKAGDYEYAQLWAMIDRVLSAHRDRKGGIHTISYQRRDDVVSRSRWASWMMVNEKGEPPTEDIGRFKDAQAGYILVSPSFGTGYDFPGPELEFNIVCKIPFEPPSKIVQARDKDDGGEYRGYRAMGLLEQMFGRGNRQDADTCSGYIFDRNMDWFMKKFGKFASKNFHNRFRRINLLPEPLPKFGV